MAEPVAARHRARDEVEGARGHARARTARPASGSALASAAIIKPFQSASTLSSRPGRTRVARDGEQFCAQRREPRSSSAVAARQRLEAIEDVVAFEIARRRDIVVPRKKFAVLAAERRASPRRATRHRTCPPRLRNRHRAKPRMRPPPSSFRARASRPSPARAARYSGLPVR